jgi:hypothetical protein
MTKDRKLATPLGLRDCPMPTCPDATESTWAQRSIPHLRNNLLGFRKLYMGCASQGEGQGFDDLLTAASASELRDRMSTDLERAERSLAALNSPDLASAVRQEPEGVRAVHEAIKRLTDALKADFTVVLQITPPKRVEGDQD